MLKHHSPCEMRRSDFEPLVLLEKSDETISPYYIFPFIYFKKVCETKCSFLQFHYLCFLPVFLLFRASIQAGRAGRRAGATSSIAAGSASHSCSVTESSSASESSSESVASRSSSGGAMVTTSSEKWTRRFSSTRLWNREGWMEWKQEWKQERWTEKGKERSS